ncbi:tudor domain-containing protein 1 [Anopheles arabiensis]|uniref:C3H1-type domain-containing protein n=1 Tax=Anopheles arabiensis TaxID=7173 RepID=A0A182HSY4_ANOAR|nr:tudor domain-containing protein 1 [Anopheles arabiensis]
MAYGTYEQLWDVSHEYLEKHVAFVNSLTSLMLERARQLRSQLFSAESTKRDTFVEDFEAAHDKLQSMGKSLQIVVNDWKRLFADQCSVLDTKPAQKPLPADTYSSFGYIAPTLDYQAGENVQLLVTYIPSPADGTFYALDDSRKDVIRNSLTTLQQMPKDFLTKAPPAGAVFAVYLDNVWHRAICNMPAAGSDTAELYLLDMGETLAYSDLLPKAKLPSDLCQLPAYAIKCQVSHTAAAMPLSLYYSVSCSVVAVENDTLIVEHAEPPREEYAISRDTLTVEELQEMDEMPLSTSNPMKAVLGYVPKDDDRLCKHYDPETKRCFKGSNCRLRHAPKDPDGWTLDKDTVTVSVPARMEVPQTNTYIQLLPTCVVDVDQFYAHIIGNERNDKEYEQLMAEMNDPETIANFKPFKLMPSLGELVIAKYDGIWYRATVCDVFDDMVNVFYFDYGNTATVGSSEVRRWEDRFKYLPYQAACCRIANIQRIKPCHLEAIDQLYKSILDKPMKALVIDNKHPWEVKLFDEDDFDIGEGLIMAKLALPRTPGKFDQNAAIPG